ETQGVTSGARRVGISPATASHRLGKLEAALNLTLLHRNSRSIRLTDEGQIFFERTRGILSDLAQAERDAGSGASALTGHLRVTMSPWILSRFVMPALPAFQRKHPDLTLEFLAVDRYVSLSAEGQDCAVRVGQMSDSAMVARKLGDNDRVICASPDLLAEHGTPTATQELVDAPWVCLPWQRRLALRDAKGRKRDATVGSRVLVSNSDMLTMAVVQGLGLAVKSRLAIREELQEGRLVEVLPGKLWEPSAPIWFVYPPEGRAGHKTKVFGDLLHTVFQ
ncbi:MAG: LysR family transcriptional regulator, partial [Pseudomonadota bacterium]